MSTDEPRVESESKPPNPVLPPHLPKNPGIYPGELFPWKGKWWEVVDVGVTQDNRFCVLLVLKGNTKRKK